jgi:hypothetical protein
MILFDMIWYEMVIGIIIQKEKIRLHEKDYVTSYYFTLYYIALYYTILN